MTPLTHSQRTAFSATTPNVLPAQPQRITLVTQNRSIRVSVEEIVWLEGAGNYTFIHTRDKRRYLMAKTLKTFEQELLGSPLARIHKSHVVNLAHVRNIDFGDAACVEMTGGKTLTIARRRISPTLNQYLQHQQIMTNLN
ncbi:LytR/AlgR family response regulator transcription factor [Spirosoma validum]|uniref:LytTR family transcriptional regulator n=1 Tax=Spirosoma validum TaxID=2771355 RepID=A0A927GE55_9BACT|nr:LytTR family DNA-binding domain-containing protein [Spirosoma validum]MBD2754492.1 LytTR family transcriptional regulator [Spirosoma validum]